MVPLPYLPLGRLMPRVRRLEANNICRLHVHRPFRCLHAAPHSRPIHILVDAEQRSRALIDRIGGIDFVEHVTHVAEQVPQAVPRGIPGGVVSRDIDFAGDIINAWMKDTGLEEKARHLQIRIALRD